jgi:hypothetical protein
MLEDALYTGPEGVMARNRVSDRIKLKGSFKPCHYKCHGLEICHYYSSM